VTQVRRTIIGIMMTTIEDFIQKPDNKSRIEFVNGVHDCSKEEIKTWKEI